MAIGPVQLIVLGMLSAEEAQELHAAETAAAQTTS
jgi:hypothetical protein